MKVLLFLAVILGLPAVAGAQTVGDIAGRRKCTTAGVEGISKQLVELHLCMFPDSVVEFAPHPGISMATSRVHPLSSVATRDALHKAAAQVPFTVESAFRVMTEQYVLYHSGACGAAATPGRSNHQTGLAVDLRNWSAARSAMLNAGCRHPLPNSDAVHFDCPGPDMRTASVLVFQKMWNIHNPNDRIAEDGAYGPQTSARIGKSPAAGFPTNGCAEIMASEGFLWAATVQDSSEPLGQDLTLRPGEVRSLWIEVLNAGTETWDSQVVLATSGPSGRESVFVAVDWIDAVQLSAVMGEVAPGQTYRFEFSLEAPQEPGIYAETFALHHPDIGTFATDGGPADNALGFRVVVMPEGAVGDAGPDPRNADVSGCAVGPGQSKATRVWWIVALLVVAWRRRRIPRA